MRRYGYLAANTGFGPGQILDMSDDDVEFWTHCLSLHFEWLNEQNEA